MHKIQYGKQQQVGERGQTGASAAAGINPLGRHVAHTGCQQRIGCGLVAS